MSSSRLALESFEHLLGKPSTKEVEFQRLFSRFPQLLSDTLPLRLQPSNIRPLGRPGRSEPDFLIQPGEQSSFDFGVIELKRPDQKILSLTARKGLVILSRTAKTAVAQTQRYLRTAKELIEPNSTVMLGNSRYAFIIMGLSDELTSAYVDELIAQEMAGLLPPNCRLIPYDVLLSWFRQQVPPEIFILAPESGADQQALPQLDDVLYDPAYWEVSDASVDYWERVAERVQSLGVPTYGLRRSYFEMSNGQLDNVTEANESLSYDIFRMLKKLNDVLPDDHRRSSAEQFLVGCETIFQSGGHRDQAELELSEREVSLLAGAMAYTQAYGRFTAPLDPGDADVQHMRERGVIRPELSEGRQQFFSILPLTRWYGPVRWYVDRVRDRATEPGQWLRPGIATFGDSAESSLDDQTEVAIYEFELGLDAAHFYDWVNDTYPGLQASVDRTAHRVALSGYADLDQFDRLGIRQYATMHLSGMRVE